MMKRLQNQILYFSANQLRKLGVCFDESANQQVLEMKRVIRALDNSAIDFSIENHPDGSWLAESTNIDGIITGGNHPGDKLALIRDAIFTYFELQPQFCRDELLRLDNQPTRVKQRLHVGV